VLLACGAEVHVATSAEDLFAQPPARWPEVVLLELHDDEGALLEALSSRRPATTRLVAIGDPRRIVTGPRAAHPDCVLLEPPDEATMRGILAGGPPASTDALVRELVSLSMFGVDLPSALQELVVRLARAFAADDCVLLMPEEAVCYMARQVSDAVTADLMTLCETVCQFGTTVIAPERPGRPYRAFLGLPLSHDNAPPLALLLLCRESPTPFGRDALELLRGLGIRLSADLSWRLVHERLLADRDKLRDLSRIDPVLGVANRTALQEEMSRRVAASDRHGEPFSVAVIDVDGLRLVNERHGYPAGDAVLAHVAQVAQVHMRPHDIVARYAGDSIAVVMPGAAATEATAILTEILSAIDATPVSYEETSINLTVSAGIAELQDNHDTGEACLGRAMAARQRARLHGEVIAVADASIVEPPAQPDFAIGTTLGGVYQIRHEMSRGAFGVVYRAVDLALGRQVALKLLRPDLARDTAFVERFRTEAATLARIRHPNLVQVFAFAVDGSSVFFAMELIEGHSLDERIQSARWRQRHLPTTEVLGVIEQVSSALEAVHRVGMLHRDVKPANVLIDRINRRCVLVDVGIAVRRGGKKNRAGTPGFTAPEVFGDGGETRATDVYSLGALAYLLLTLEAPFGEAEPIEILQMQATRRPAPLTSLRRDLPPAVDDVVLAALDPDPAQRPQSARELAKALTEVLTRPGIAPRQTVERIVELPSELRRRVTIHAPTLPSAPSTLPGGPPSLQSPPPAVPCTRGILFRSAYEVLGARRGGAFVAELSRKEPELAQALSSKSSALAWHPTSTFLSILRALGGDDDERRRLSFQLGRTAVDASFRQFYGADPSAMSPAQVLRTSDLFWRCYHSWGRITVAAHETDAEVTVTEGVTHSTLCASTAGLLSGIVAHSGGSSVAVEQRACVNHGAAGCVFHLTWR